MRVRVCVACWCGGGSSKRQSIKEGGGAQLAAMMSALTVASKASPGKRGLLGRTSRMPDELSEPAAGFAASVTESALEVATTVPPQPWPKF